MNRLNVKILPLPHAKDLPLPAHATKGSAGVDLMAAIDTDFILASQKSALIPCGFSIYLPEGYEAQIRPRSGLALKHGITVLNSPGTVDSDYTGEVKVLLINLGSAPFIIERGMRIAQLIIAEYNTIAWDIQDVEPLQGERDKFGFGSTGM